MRVPTDNPNRAKRRPATHVRTPRTGMRAAAGSGRQGTTGTTVYVVDPAYLARYGTAAAVARAERNQRTGETTGAARVVARNRRSVRGLA